MKNDATQPQHPDPRLTVRELDRVHRGKPGDLFAAALGFSARGGTYAAFRATLSHLGVDLDHESLLTAWDRAVTEQVLSASVALARLDALEAAAAQPWPGQAGVSDLAVLRAIITLGRRHRRLPVAGARDELAVLAGVHPATARRALSRLQADGWLRRTAAPTASRAAEWEPGPLADRLTATTTQVEVDLGMDAARWGALGKSVVRVWGLLGETPATSPMLASQIDRAHGTVRRQLERLAEHGLAEHTRQGWVRGEATLEDVAAQLGMAGRRQREADRLATRRSLRARYGPIARTHGVMPQEA